MTTRFPLLPFLLALAFALAFAPAARAVPILSADGSLLSGVDVPGYGLYDIALGDGLTSDVFGGVTFDSARRAEADAVSTAVASALFDLSAAASSIAGCEGAVCYIFIPDRLESPGFSPLPVGTWYADDGIVLKDPQWYGGEWVSPTPPSISAYRFELFDSASSPFDTIGQYARRSAVAVPAPWALTVFGVALLWLRAGRTRR